MNLPQIPGCGDAAYFMAAIVVAAFVSEDGATITAAALAASNVFDLKLAFFSALAGLLLGDLSVYALARRMGPPILRHRWFKGWRAAEQRTRQLATASLFGLALFALVQTWRRWGRQLHDRVAVSVGRIKRWEFWPAWLFYSPVAIFCVWLGIRYRSFSLPTVSNLNQRNGGIVGESKIAILRTLMETSPEFTSDGYPVPPGALAERLERIRDIGHRNQISYPLVLKPDTAQRGAGFKKIESLQEAERYLATVSAPLVLQRYVPGPHEAGIFYYRFPHEARGHIFGITRKRFPVLIGDGVRTVRQLIAADARARLMAPTYFERFGTRVDWVLERGEHLRLVEAGNHCQGSFFRMAVTCLQRLFGLGSTRSVRNSPVSTSAATMSAMAAMTTYEPDTDSKLLS